MEHRQSPLRAAGEDAAYAEGGDPLTSRRFSRFVSPHSVRRVALPRVALAALAASGVVVMVALLGSYALRFLPAYLHRQPAYQLRFQDIVLDPPPPPWYSGGSTAFLERVKAAHRQPEVQSMLDLDLERLGDVFRLDPWVAKVSRVESAHPNRVVVHLTYRRPVAAVIVDASRIVVLDGEGVVLSEKEIDRRACGPLIQLNDIKVPPAVARPGQTWKKESARRGDVEVDELVLQEAALAGYLTSVQHELDRGTGERLVFAVRAHKGLWVQYGHRFFHWGEAPGYESTDPLKAAAKWEVLRDWLLESPAPKGAITPENEHYRITPTGIENIKSVRGDG
jgi:hypothetical protein